MAPDTQEKSVLDPCPQCGASPHPDMGDHYKNEHCYACGYRPGTSVDERRQFEQQFAEFQRWREQQQAQDLAHKSLQPPESQEEVESLRAQLAAVQDELAARNSAGGFTPPEENQFGGGIS